MNTTNAEMFW